MEDRVLALIRDRDRILLERISVGFGAGLLGGLYGKPQEGESIPEALFCELSVRGIVPLRYEQRGLLNVVFQESPLELRTHVYDVSAYEDIGLDSRLEWHARLPYPRMLPDYGTWLRRFLRGDGVLGRVVYEHPQRPRLVASHFSFSRKSRASTATA